MVIEMSFSRLRSNTKVFLRRPRLRGSTELTVRFDRYAAISRYSVDRLTSNSHATSSTSVIDRRLSPWRSRIPLISSWCLQPSCQARCFSSSSKTRSSTCISTANCAPTFSVEILTIDGQVNANCQIKWIFSNIMAKATPLIFLHSISQAKMAADSHDGQGVERSNQRDHLQRG